MMRTNDPTRLECRAKHQPIRTCVGCRDRMSQSELIKFNLRNGELVVVCHELESLGRSIYLCPREKCFDAAFRTGSVLFKRCKHDRIVVKLNNTERYILKNRFMALVKLRFESGQSE